MVRFSCCRNVRMSYCLSPFRGTKSVQSETQPHTAFKPNERMQGFLFHTPLFQTPVFFSSSESSPFSEFSLTMRLTVQEWVKPSGKSFKTHGHHHYIFVRPYISGWGIHSLSHGCTSKFPFSQTKLLLSYRHNLRIFFITQPKPGLGVVSSEI